MGPSMWKPVPVEKAIGKKLLHDITLITERAKGAIFKKGHIIKPEDVELLKNAGHYYVFVEESVEEDVILEDEAVKNFAKYISGPNTYIKSVEEGKAMIFAKHKGLLKVSYEGLLAVNNSGTFIVVTRQGNIGVSKGELIAVVDLVPLAIRKNEMKEIKVRIRKHLPLVYVKPFKKKKVGLVVTGTEIYEGRIKDLASDKVKEKVEKYGGTVCETVILPDNEELIKSKILEYIAKYDIVILTGGMSVDPTDKTPKAIALTGAKIVAYGIPVKPTTMTIIAYLNSKPIIGVSSGIIYFKEENVLDILLPKIMADEFWTKEDIAKLGYGGIMPIYLMKKISKHKSMST